MQACNISIVADLREFQATERSTEHSALVFGGEAALWSTPAEKAGKWYLVVAEAAERFMVR